VFTGIVRDLTERKQLEAQLRQAQKMEAVGQLAGGVAHDFNNVLTGITGYTQLALRRVAPEDPSRHYIEEIQSAAFRATNLSRQLLAFSRQQVMSPRVIDLRAVVTDLSKMLRRLIGEDIELSVTTGSEVAQAKADPGQIEQVIVNLAVNARDAMPEGGKLHIDVTTTEPQQRLPRQVGLRPGPYVVLTVSDTGTGMTAAVRAHIFEPFFTTKEPGRGTGLGLATVYGIVTQSGGHIHVDSTPGKGSAFHIYLPRVAQTQDAAAQRVVTASSFAGTETILLVEDDDTVRHVNAEQLRVEGYRVLSARNGDEALDLSRSTGNIDLLVTDVVMPGVNGRDLAVALLRQHPKLKVLFVSAHPQATALPPGQAPAQALFLQKPFRPGELARKVRGAIDARRR
jgi:nitrogen-specific signal transduction histidine kinase